MKKLVTILILLIFSNMIFAQETNIIPQPAEIHKKEGNFRLTSDTKILFNASSQQEKDFVELTQAMLDESCGLKVEHLNNAKEIKGNILVQLNSPFDSKIGNEGYKLTIQNDRVLLNANTSAGLFYGMQTIWQLLTPEKENILPCMEITDYPRFGWRGLHLDVSRHFMPTTFIYKYIDYIALHKMNVFHWHLIDDQGWRIEIKKYPKLTEIGAFRTDREDLEWDSRKEPVKGDEPMYGGFYTQEEVKDIVAYAAKKHVTIVPEIEMPAHAMSALAAYPEFSCTGEYIPVPSGGVWPITHIYCPGKEETFNFLEDVLSEVMEIFPSSYIHIGGDEATKTEWEKCPLCQKRMKAEELKDEHELQAYFIKRIEKFLNKNGRQLIGWDEILEGGLNPSATIMSWRGAEPGTKAAKLGHDVVMSPTTPCYFNFYQGNPELEPTTIGGLTTLKKVYDYEPVPEVLSFEEAKHIIGAQANIWTEYIPAGKNVEYMIMPRMAALSEVLWSPKGTKNWDYFSKRMNAQFSRYDKMGINYATSAFQVTAQPMLDPVNKTVKVSLVTEAWEPEIHYTTDNTEPNANSKRYTTPIKLTESATVKAVSVKNGKPLSEALATNIFIHKAIACPLSLKFANSEDYNSTGEFALVNGIKGTKNYGDGNWLGFNGTDLVATIDLGETKSFSMVKVGVLQNTGSWIFYPTQMMVEGSIDGDIFTNIGTLKNNVISNDSERQIQDLAIKKKAKARFVKVTLKNFGTCPKGHVGEGKPAWLFVDEIVIE